MESATLADAEVLVATRLSQPVFEEPSPGVELSKDEQRARLRARMQRDRLARRRR